MWLAVTVSEPVKQMTTAVTLCGIGLAMTCFW
jgi:hypothetical protein